MMFAMDGELILILFRRRYLHRLFHFVIWYVTVYNLIVHALYGVLVGGI